MSLSLCATVSAAADYVLTQPMDSVIGDPQRAKARADDTLLDIARRHGLGYQDITLANPGIDTWLPGAGTDVHLPTRFVLPHAPREGLILNIPERRLYYFFPATSDGAAQTVVTHPLGVGRQGWETPFVKTRITGKRKHPAWYPPASIREEAAANGEPLPERVDPGPHNPLGDFAMRLGLPSYLIHGTNRPWGVGMRVSHGCIRLYPEDIESLYQQIQVGTAVRIVNQPYKIGVLNSVIYLEAHPRLQEDEQHGNDKLTAVVNKVIDRLPEAGYTIDWDRVREVVDQADSIPVAIGTVKANHEVKSIPQPRVTGISQSRVLHQE